MLFLILAGLFIIFAGLNADKWAHKAGQPLMGCGIVLIVFVVVLIFIWP